MLPSFSASLPQGPCKTSVFVNYFLGTTCLPDKPIDVKPKKKKDDDKKE